MKLLKKFILGIVIIIFLTLILVLSKEQTDTWSFGLGYVSTKDLVLGTIYWGVYGALVTYALKLIFSVIRDTIKNLIKNITNDTSNLTTFLKSKFDSYKINRNEDNQIKKKKKILYNKIKNIDLRIESYKKMKETGEMPDEDKNKYLALTKERLSLAEKISDLDN